MCIFYKKGGLIIARQTIFTMMANSRVMLAKSIETFGHSLRMLLAQATRAGQRPGLVSKSNTHLFTAGVKKRWERRVVLVLVSFTPVYSDKIV